MQRYAKGFALMMSLIFLTILSMVATFTFRSVRNDQKTINFFSDFKLAQQAASLALADAELDLETPDTSGALVDSAGQLGSLFVDGCGTSDRGKGYCTCDTGSGSVRLRDLLQEDAQFQTNNAVTIFSKTGASGLNSNLAKLPFYMIERCADPLNSGATPKFLYRITAKAFGRSIKTTIVLEEIYQTTH